MMEQKNIIKKAEEIFAARLKKGDAVIAAISGGPDSTALLDALCVFAQKMPVKIIAAHVNHGLRGKETLKDEDFVRKLARQSCLKFELKRVKINKKSGAEEQGRRVRRAFSEKLLRKYGARFIITAHTEDDQLETIVFNFIRGAGLAGLAGMREADGVYLKPFLSVPKKEILAYLKSRGLKFRVDKTNADERFSRNFIRHKILPMMERLNPSVRRTFVKNARIFRGLERYLAAQAEQFLKTRSKKSGGKGFLFEAKDFAALPAALRQAVIQRAFKKMSREKFNPSNVKTLEVLRLIERNIGKKRIHVGRRGFFFVDKGKVYFKKHV